VVRLSPHQKVVLECVHSKEQKQSPTEVDREFNNIMRLDGRTGAVQDLIGIDSRVELYGFVAVERKGRDLGRGFDFYISLQDLLSEKCC
jgi:hypothetical protein